MHQNPFEGGGGCAFMRRCLFLLGGGPINGIHGDNGGGGLLTSGVMMSEYYSLSCMHREMMSLAKNKREE